MIVREMYAKPAQAVKIAGLATSIIVVANSDASASNYALIRQDIDSHKTTATGLQPPHHVL